MVESMVDLVGIEPTTSSMPWKRAPSCATGPFVCGAWQISAKPYFIFAYWGMGVKPDSLQKNFAGDYNHCAPASIL